MKRTLFLILCFCSVFVSLKAEDFYDGTLEAAPLKEEEGLPKNSPRLIEEDGLPKNSSRVEHNAPVRRGDQLDDRLSQLEEQVRHLQGKIEELQHDLKEIRTHQASQEPRGELPSRADVTSDTKERKNLSEKEDADDSDASALQEGPVLQRYEKAQGYLTQQAYPEAERTLKDLIRAYPSDPLAVNARYWLGETYYVQKDYKRAATAFADTYKAYRKLDHSQDLKDKQSRKTSFAKAPEALVKLALSLKALGKNEQACVTLDQLRSEFPHLPRNVKQLAEKAEQSLNQCKKAEKALE